MKPLFLIIVILSVLILPITNVVAAPCPVATTEESIIGVWEAFEVKKAFRVFRVELNKTGDSILSHGLYQTESIDGLSSYLTQQSLKSGKVVFRFQSQNQNIIGVSLSVNGQQYKTTGISEIRGVARVCAQSTEKPSTIEAKLILEPDSPAPIVWNLLLIKTHKKGIGEIVAQMAKNAKRSAEQMKRQRGN